MDVFVPSRLGMYRLPMRSVSYAQDRVLPFPRSAVSLFVFWKESVRGRAERFMSADPGHHTGARRGIRVRVGLALSMFLDAPLPQIVGKERLVVFCFGLIINERF